MKAQRQDRVKILAVFDLRFESGRTLLSGVLDSLQRRRNLEFHLIESGNAFNAQTARRILREGYAGIIATDSGTSEAMSLLASSSIPLVLVNIPKIRLSDSRPNVSFVWTDNFDIGEKAAQHLLSLSCLRSFGFASEVGPNPAFWSEERRIAFERKIKDAGYSVSVSADENLEDWLLKLPKPAGIMAAYDVRAAAVLAACRRLKLDVPDQVAVIGVDNDESCFGGERNPLSSVVPDFRLMGEEATKEMFSLIGDNGRRSSQEIVIPAKELIVRDSTTPHTSAVRLVNAIRNYIDDNLQHDIHVADIVRQLGCSRRLAELRFREVQGHSLRQAIEIARLNMARQMLQTTNKTTDQIAAACGLKSKARLFHLVRQHFGCTVGEMRKQL